MATTANTTVKATARADRGGILSAIANGFNAYLERQSRSSEIRRLNAMSDEQLAKLGITREGIPQYVFRDMFYL